jgi:hypothetical protein
MSRRVKLCCALVITLVAAAFVALGSGQRVVALNGGVSISTGEGEHSGPPLGTDKLVFLEVEEFGYSAFTGVEGELVGAYNHLVANGASLTLTCPEELSEPPLVVAPETIIALNFESSSSDETSAKFPFLLDRLPWKCETRGAPLMNYLHDEYAPFKANQFERRLKHALAITAIASDGTVAITAEEWRVLLSPGGKVRISRSVGLWSSAVTIEHKGVFEKAKVVGSKGLRVVADGVERTPRAKASH